MDFGAVVPIAIAATLTLLYAMQKERRVPAVVPVETPPRRAMKFGGDR